MAKTEVVNKFKTLSQGQYSESVLDKMAMTFTALCGFADFEAEVSTSSSEEDSKDASTDAAAEHKETKSKNKGMAIGGLVYNIQLILPESRDPKVYDALFESLRRHLS